MWVRRTGPRRMYEFVVLVLLLAFTFILVRIDLALREIAKTYEDLAKVTEEQFNDLSEQISRLSDYLEGRSSFNDKDSEEERDLRFRLEETIEKLLEITEKLGTVHIIFSLALKQNPELSQDDALVIALEIARESWKQGIDPLLAAAVASVESRFKQDAVSRKGAAGYMQLMPLASQATGVNRYDPRQNLRGGIRYLAQMLRRFDGNLKLALAAYNAGPSKVARIGRVPNIMETKRYVEKVQAAYKELAAN